MSLAANTAEMKSLHRFRSGSIIPMHLMPGLPTALAYTLFAALLVPRGLPNMMALMLAILLVEVPVSWTIIVR